MRCTVISYSLSSDPSTLKEWKEKLFKEISSLILSGSEIILYPELFLMGLSKYVSSNSVRDELLKTSQLIQNEVLPELAVVLKGKDVLVVLGSGPEEKDGILFNTCPIWSGDRWKFQSKLFLTPWETEFQAGECLQIFQFQDLKIAVVICFDSEQPDLSCLLKKEEIEVLLIPSATTNKNGTMRVNRCASARAIELGAVVITAPLVGDSKCELVDHNEGLQGFFLPAQEDVTVNQEIHSEYSEEKHLVVHYEIDVSMIKKIKRKTEETKPYHKDFHPHISVNK